MSLPEIILAANRQTVAQIAQAMLDGEISIVEGSRDIASRHGDAVGVDQVDSDFMIFMVIATDEDPAAAEAFYRKDALESCARLVARFADAKPPTSAYEYYSPDT
jgi:hypothetical protein